MILRHSNVNIKDCLTQGHASHKRIRFVLKVGRVRAVGSVYSRVPTRTGKPGKPGKMGRLFPVREKSGNFEQTGKVREKSGKITQNTGKIREFEIILFDIFNDI